MLDTVYAQEYIFRMWTVLLGDEFKPEFLALPKRVRVEIAAVTELLEEFGPQMGRPRVDTLNGSKHANMKELRFDAAEGVWRVAFAFDLDRQAILLVTGDKSGGSQARFYRELVRKADVRFDAHLLRLKRLRAAQKTASKSVEESPSRNKGAK
jgi:hypothetical protein